MPRLNVPVVDQSENLTMSHSEKGRFERRIPELDGIRGVAILTVVCFHYFKIPSSDGAWPAKVCNAILSFGWSGVDLFFVLSGFLIGGILIDNRHAQNYFKTFYIRRICRIFPLYYLWLALYYLLPYLLPPGFLGVPPLSHGVLYFPKLGYVFFLQNFYRTGVSNFDGLWMGMTWSLAIEEQFYLFLPALLWFALPRKPFVWLIILILLVPVLRVVLFLFYSSLFIQFLLPSRADTLLIGVLCAYLVRQKSVRYRLGQNIKMLYALLVPLSLGMGYLISLGYGYSHMKVINSFEMTTYGFTLIALFYACLLLIAIVDKTSVVARWLRIPLLRHFGVIAYGIYLFHTVIRQIALQSIFGYDTSQATILSQNLLSVAAFFATWLVAMLSWRFFEGPIVRWGHSFRYPEKRPIENNSEVPNR